MFQQSEEAVSESRIYVPIFVYVYDIDEIISA